VSPSAIWLKQEALVLRADEHARELMRAMPVRRAVEIAIFDKALIAKPKWILSTQTTRYHS
jgi:hypothetical protein